MRLINADELTKEIKKQKNICMTSDFVMHKINNQPTAYDVDKVADMINDAIMETLEYKHKFCETVDQKHCVQYKRCEDCMSEQMIEIVKSGGIG